MGGALGNHEPDAAVPVHPVSGNVGASKLAIVRVREAWHNNVRLSQTSLLDREAALGSRAVGAEGEMSMVLRADGASLCWVSWTRPDIREGRVVRLDGQNKPV